ncbi:MAG: CD225/dispanin family protein [Prevotella sp.]|nr:CD225/dispanin family protein [Prevotella sp.]
MDYQNQGQYYPKPDNHLVLAIICTAFCCMPIGIYAIIKANDVNSQYNMQQYALAEQSAAEAKKWSIIGIVASGVIGILFFIFYIGAIVLAAAGGNF